METHLLQDLALVMAVAGAMTLICHRLKQPVVIGYLLAGLVIGPYTPPFSLIHNLDSIHTMAELGLVFLLFSLGLEFNLPKIRKVGLSAGLAAVLEVAGMLVIGAILGRLFGWSWTNSIFLGAILSISSTTIIVKVFMDFKMMHEKFAQVVFGILVLEDIVAVAILSILSGLGSQGGPGAATVLSSFLRIGLFVILFLVLGLLLIPRFMQWVGGFKSKEVLGIVTLGLCLCGSLLAAKFQLSIALGAFLTGAVLAASNEINQIEEWIYPVRDMFSAIFFVSAGMLIQPQLLWEHKIPIVVVTLVTLAGKIFTGAAGTLLVSYDIKTSARVGMSLAQIGEFSFVIASLGLALQVTSDFLYPLAVTVSSLTTLATPYMIRNSDRWVDSLARIMPASIHSALNNYHEWVVKTKPTAGSFHGTSIFSKYLVRLGVYLAVALAWILLMRAVSERMLGLSNGQLIVALLWAISIGVCLPIFMNISKYENHIILLLVSRNKRILHHINVHIFYNTLHWIAMLILGAALLISAAGYIQDTRILVGLGAGLFFASFIIYRRFTIAKEWLESILDQVTGLATSEPTRQAVLRTGERTLLLYDITDQVTLPDNSPAHHRTIRELRLREQTGASIVAIYREGQHIANPGPDLELLPDDVLILLGDENDLAKAKVVLLPQ